MGRPPGSKNRSNDITPQGFNVAPSIRQLRQSAIAAGARIGPVESREFLICEINRLGEPPEIVRLDAVLVESPSTYSEIRTGEKFEIHPDGQFYLNGVPVQCGIDVLIDCLTSFRDNADAHFDTEHERVLSEKEQERKRLESIKHFDGTPEKPSASHLRIMELAKNLGAPTCDIGHALRVVAMAYGVPFGEKAEDHGELVNRMFNQDEMEALVLKAMEVPL